MFSLLSIFNLISNGYVIRFHMVSKKLPLGMAEKEFEDNRQWKMRLDQNGAVGKLGSQP